MSDDAYLWDGSGEPDAEIARLERTLGSLRYDRPAPPPPVARRRRPLHLWAAVAAAVLVGVSWLVVRPGAEPPPDRAWRVERTALAADGGVASDPARGAVNVGDWIETGATERARLEVADIGTLDVLPRSRVRLVRTGVDEHRVRLDRGAIHAVVVAPPRLFVVETPAADAVDLGCEYTLEVDAAGDGLLAVASGWVSLERAGRAAVVPQGAVCTIHAGRGPGTPRAPDAPARLREALERMDAGQAAGADLETVLSSARREDAVTLWHLLAAVEGAARERVHDRLAVLVPPPFGATRERVLALDPDALEVWLDEAVWGAGD